MVTGCTTLTSYDIPESLKQKCSDLQELESGKAKDVINVMVDDRIKYGECARRHAAVIEIIEKSSK